MENTNAVATSSTNNDLLLELTSEIVSALLGNSNFRVNNVGEVTEMIASVHDALKGKTSGAVAEEAPKAELKPPVPIKKSVHNDYIICLEDGMKFKSLKRHLMTHYGMTPEDYRTKWGLPNDYPMVAPAYAAARSALAKEMGLGQGRRKAAA